MRPAPLCSLRGQACGEHPWVAASPGPFSGAQLAAGARNEPGAVVLQRSAPGQSTPTCSQRAGNTFPVPVARRVQHVPSPLAAQPVSPGGTGRLAAGRCPAPRPPAPQPAASPLCQPLGSPLPAPRCPPGAGGGRRHPMSQPSPVAARLPLPTLPEPAQTFLRNKEKSLRVLLCRLQALSQAEFSFFFFFLFPPLRSDVFLPRTCRD